MQRRCAATDLTRLDRRNFSKALMALPWLGTLGATQACAQNRSAAHRPRAFGAAVRAEQIFGDAAFAAIVTQNCAFITPEIELNWNKVEPREGELDFYQADQIADFASLHGKRMGGHILLWHLGIPDWAVPGLAAPNGWNLVRRYIASVMPRYSAVTDYWEVVNEPLLMGYRMDGLRPTPYLSAFGPTYIDRAFREARLFAPHARLSINEFGLEYTYRDEHDRRYHFLRLLERLKKANVPIDGVGLQSHLDLRKNAAFDPAVVADFLHEIAGMGLEIRVTELDVKEYDYGASREVRDMAVADAARRYLDVVMACPAVTQICCWGLSDRFSWLTVTPEDLARGHWPDGQGPGFNRGLPFDSDMLPKPFWHILQQELGK